MAGGLWAWFAARQCPIQLFLQSADKALVAQRAASAFGGANCLMSSAVQAILNKTLPIINTLEQRRHADQLVILAFEMGPRARPAPVP